MSIKIPSLEEIAGFSSVELVKHDLEKNRVEFTVIGSPGFIRNAALKFVSGVVVELDDERFLATYGGGTVTVQNPPYGPIFVETGKGPV